MIRLDMAGRWCFNSEKNVFKRGSSRFLRNRPETNAQSARFFGGRRPPWLGRGFFCRTERKNIHKKSTKCKLLSGNLQKNLYYFEVTLEK